MPVKLQHILKRVQDLPPLPTSAMRVIALTKNPVISVKELETVIGQDLALTAGILRQANSAFYGYARRISSIQDAIVLLGFQAIQGLAMSAAIAPYLRPNLWGTSLNKRDSGNIHFLPLWLRNGCVNTGNSLTGMLPLPLAYYMISEN